MSAEQKRDSRGRNGRGLARARVQAFRTQGDFDDPRHEWRRLFSELLGTFFLVLVGVRRRRRRSAVRRGDRPGHRGGRPGAHGHGDHPLHGRRLGRSPESRRQHRVRGPRRLPVASRAGLHHRAARCDTRVSHLVGHPRQAGRARATEPGAGVSDWEAMLFELLLTLGLVSTILGTASGAQNVGLFGALAVGGYIILAGFWSSLIQRRIDEPGQVVRPGCCQRRLLELLGSTSGRSPAR